MQRARHCLALLACHLLEHFDLAQHGARLIHQQQTSLGEQHLATRTLQQHDAKLIFQLADLPAQRWLANVTGVCRSSEVTMFG